MPFSDSSDTAGENPGMRRQKNISPRPRLAPPCRLIVARRSPFGILLIPDSRMQFAFFVLSCPRTHPLQPNAVAVHARSHTETPRRHPNFDFRFSSFPFVLPFVPISICHAANRSWVLSAAIHSGAGHLAQGPPDTNPWLPRHLGKCLIIQRIVNSPYGANGNKFATGDFGAWEAR